MYIKHCWAQHRYCRPWSTILALCVMHWLDTGSLQPVGCHFCHTSDFILCASGAKTSKGGYTYYSPVLVKYLAHGVTHILWHLLLSHIQDIKVSQSHTIADEERRLRPSTRLGHTLLYCSDELSVLYPLFTAIKIRMVGNAARIPKRPERCLTEEVRRSDNFL